MMFQTGKYYKKKKNKNEQYIIDGYDPQDISQCTFQ